MKILLKLCLSAAVTLSCANLAAAATYKWVDKDGTVHYTQHAPTQGKYEQMNVQTQSPSSDSSGSSQSTPSYSTPSSSSSSSSSDNSSASDVIKQETAKAEAQRKKKCETAKKALETYTVYRRVRDKSGKVIRLDDKERAKRISESKSAIQEFCQ